MNLKGVILWNRSHTTRDIFTVAYRAIWEEMSSRNRPKVCRLACTSNALNTLSLDKPLAVITSAFIALEG